MQKLHVLRYDVLRRLLRFPVTDVLGSLLHCGQPVPTSSHLHGERRDEVPWQASRGDAAPSLLHRRQRVRKHAAGAREPVDADHVRHKLQHISDLALCMTKLFQWRVWRWQDREHEEGDWLLRDGGGSAAAQGRGWWSDEEGDARGADRTGQPDPGGVRQR